MDRYHKKSRQIHGTDFQKADLKSYDGGEMLKTPT